MIPDRATLWIFILGLVLGAVVYQAYRAFGDQPAPDTVLSRAYMARTAPNTPPPPTTRTVVTPRGDRITYRPSPARPPDFVARLTTYQPRAHDNRPWHDAATGGGANDCRGQALKWGVLAGAVRKFGYGARVFLGAPLWQEFVLRDTFAHNKPADRFDLCAYWPEQFRYWDGLCDGAGGTLRVDCWLLREGE